MRSTVAAVRDTNAPTLNPPAKRRLSLSQEIQIIRITIAADRMFDSDIQERFIVTFARSNTLYVCRCIGELQLNM